jgi:hypothetical protein
MEIKKYFKENQRYYTKALRFFKNGNVKLILSYSKSKDGRLWHDNDKTPRKLGYFKSQEFIFTARALVVGSHKFSLLVSNK